MLSLSAQILIRMISKLPKKGNLFHQTGDTQKGLGSNYQIWMKMDVLT